MALTRSRLQQCLWYAGTWQRDESDGEEMACSAVGRLADTGVSANECGGL